ncbi:MAG: HAD family hydrolase [Candidatus Brocadiales bacterium]
MPGSPTWSQLVWAVNRDSTLGPTSSILMPPPMPDSSNLLSPEEIMCVGDRIEDELAAATALGIPTAMLRHGRHYERFASSPQREMTPDFFINNVGELLDLIS